jgi:C1A family cysteine protease
VSHAATAITVAVAVVAACKSPDERQAVGDVSTPTRPRRLTRATGARALVPSFDLTVSQLRTQQFVALHKTQAALEPAFSWKERNKVSTVITDQGKDCSTCWIFAGVAAFESNYARKHGTSAPKLSEQRMLDCIDNASCDRLDTPWPVFEYLRDKGGVDASAEPYVAYKHASCATMTSQYFAATPLDVGDKLTVQELKDSLTALGPLAVQIDANQEFIDWHSSAAFDKSGGYTEAHYVLLIGWDDHKGSGAWQIKNSWGNWGENDSGFGWVQYDCNGIGSYAMTVEPR